MRGEGKRDPNGPGPGERREGEDFRLWRVTAKEIDREPAGFEEIGDHSRAQTVQIPGNGEDEDPPRGFAGGKNGWVEVRHDTLGDSGRQVLLSNTDLPILPEFTDLPQRGCHHEFEDDSTIHPAFEKAVNNVRTTLDASEQHSAKKALETSFNLVTRYRYQTSRILSQPFVWSRSCFSFKLAPGLRGRACGSNPVQEVIVLAATNRPDRLDPAILRPGRLGLHIEIPLPDKQEREEIFRVHLAGRPREKMTAFENLAERTGGQSGAEIAEIVDRAAATAVRRVLEGKTVLPPAGAELRIEQADLIAAIEELRKERSR